ncbi:MerR family transcriptional regulator [Flavobacterium jejuense]|uniref:MerR family transcriptional regulator n=1 Tax=Flavobacterium jejuense TaxID=1544455 RepID=A0ABX0IUH6_9FLAO|nr:MerR family transcriptional regulator [Flavobacterium jejuense]NHN26188.1 MerR family transcriptional regulator [Flavobacterium jejuense]
MNNIKTSFSVKDLENLSGIKAHTIRIWEKRYSIFSPDRNENNIRSYDSEDLLKLLNITFLNNFGYKISKISSLSDEDMNSLVKQIYSDKNSSSLAISSLKYAMFNFDTKLFHETYDKLIEIKSFEEIFYEVFIPLLDEIGMLWQTSTLKPIHEHFISSLIKQKLYSAIEQTHQKNNYCRKKVFVLYLPMHEIHELGLVFVNYLLLNKGYNTLYLGESVPMKDLEDMKTYFDEVHFISYFTVQPLADDVDAYLNEFQETLLENTTNKFYVLGKQIEHVANKYEGITFYSGIQSLVLSL